MLIQVMNVMATIYYWTWFIWPFTFVFGLAKGIKRLMQPNLVEPSDAFNGDLIKASISLLFIIAGIVSPNFF